MSDPALLARVKQWLMERAPYNSEVTEALVRDLLTAVQIPSPWPDPEVVVQAGLGARLPGGYQWGQDAMEQFEFGKKRATESILALFTPPAEKP